MDVHIVWHVRHARSLAGPPTPHRDGSGDVLIDEEFDDVKLIGIYSEQPGCFTSSSHTAGEEHWPDGFVTIPVTAD